jgi:hypothetical protein
VPRESAVVVSETHPAEKEVRRMNATLKAPPREVDTYTDIDEIAKARVAELAAQITGNKQLRHLLRQVKPGLRKQVFEEWRPHLTFEPWNYLKLVR